ncbi:MAG: hypothetical protein JWM98_2736 [Thermoleophilia bacterium]|nr:hypothetical protein [Thermoleophilia bacterium]
MRRVLAAFAVVVVLLPVAALGGAWTLVLVPLVLSSAVALREALRLRRSARLRSRDGAAPGR